MVQLTRIYTKSGDKGKTALGNGKRLFKDHLRFEAIGAVDEVNAHIGVAILHVSEKIKPVLTRIQNDLFDLGADLCMPLEDDTPEVPALRIVEEQVHELEHLIDVHNAELEPLKSFVLPGGTGASAYLHIARTTTRSAERVLVTLSRNETLSPFAVQYINRLSDLLFVLCRYENHINGEGDVLWVPGANRPSFKNKQGETNA